MPIRKPSAFQFGAIIGFAFSCFALLLFLWVSFGGPVPLKPEGYRFEVPLNEATQLAQESDVRISGVSVGKVKSIALGDENDQNGLAVATIEIDDRYAPIPEDTRAILREKTLLGESYVELSQGSNEVPTLPEGGSLPRAQVADSVQLDEIVRTFDERTRVAFQNWMQGAAAALNGRGADLNAAIGNLAPFAEDADRVLRILDSQRLATNQFVRNTGVVFGSLAARQGELRGLVQNADTVFSTTARRDQDLEQAFIALPTFLDESRATLKRLQRFAEKTDPLTIQLLPVAKQLSGSLIQLGRLSPELKGFFSGFRRVAKNSKQGLPVLQRLLDTDLPPFLTEFTPFQQQLTPILQALSPYRREVTALLGNVAASFYHSTSPETGSVEQSYRPRGGQLLNPEELAAFPNRLTTNRNNPYTKAGGYNLLSGGLESFFGPGTPGCSGGVNATITNGGANPLPAGVFNNIKHFAYLDQNSTATLPAPGCAKQAQFQSIGKIPELTDYLHVYDRGP
ncbi:MAG: MCE family protein [Solirubrobacterales bacterium]|nr:MCE family protein [Solirubrobacterales bacterium]